MNKVILISTIHQTGGSLMNLPQLPSLNKSKTTTKEAYIDNNRSSSELRLPELHNSNKSSLNYLLDKRNSIDNDLMLSGRMAIEYEKLRNSYRSLIQSFEESIQRDLRVFEKSSNKLSEYKFESLSDFEQAVERGFLNLKHYSVSEINELIKDLNELEEKLISRDIKEYNFKTIDQFQNAVDRGIIDLSRYDTVEINDLLASLDDEPMKLSDYDITMFGKIELAEIEHEFNSYSEKIHKNKTKPKPLTKEKLNEIRANKDKQTILPQPPKVSPKPHIIKTEIKHLTHTEDIESILEQSFFKRLLNRIKDKILRNKKKKVHDE